MDPPAVGASVDGFSAGFAPNPPNRFAADAGAGAGAADEERLKTRVVLVSNFHWLMAHT